MRGARAKAIRAKVIESFAPRDGVAYLNGRLESSRRNALMNLYRRAKKAWTRRASR